MNQILIGDGTWPFTVEVLGDDLIVHDTYITCFGGIGGGVIYDPDDSGRTAFGRNTKREEISGVALPCSTTGRQVDPATHKALDGSPMPWLEGAIPVEVTITYNGASFTYTPPDGLVDIGPSKRVQQINHPKALDLSVWAARHFDKHFKPQAQQMTPKQLARGFEMHGRYRVIGGAKFVK